MADDNTAATLAALIMVLNKKKILNHYEIAEEVNRMKRGGNGCPTCGSSV